VSEKKNIVEGVEVIADQQQFLITISSKND